MTAIPQPQRKSRLTLYILIALVAGIALGYGLNQTVLQNADAATKERILGPFSLLADIFLRLIKMIVAPLVFSTLVVGVAKLGDIKSVGRIGGKTMLWFISASMVSLLVGMVLVNFFSPVRI